MPSGLLVGLFLRCPLGTPKAKTDLTVVRVDSQNLDLNLIAYFNHILRLLDLVVRDFRDMQKTLQAGLEFDEYTERGYLAHCALDDLPRNIFLRNSANPRVFGHLLHAQ